MTKKDYELIADMFATHRPARAANERVLWLEMLSTMADALAHENPKFNRDKFFLACEYRKEV